MTAAIIGGGASGLMAALTAAERGNRVILFERQARVGRKLLATGNGRCNLTNTRLSLDNYNGQNADFARYALESFDTEAALEFFRALGLITVEEDSGRVYPLSDQAGSVVDVLRLAADEMGVEVRTGQEVRQAKCTAGGFTVITDSDRVHADALLVCCGGKAGGRLGGTASGYELLKSFGHTCTPLYPALVQLRTDTAYVRSLKGVRADAAVYLTVNGKTQAKSAGEVQFTDYGVSGPAVFEISRAASVCDGERRVELDLLRNVDKSDAAAMIEARVALFPSLTLENLLTGMVHNRLGRVVLRYAGYDLNAPVTGIKVGDCQAIAAALKHFVLPVTGTQGFDDAQVTAGGIKTSEFDPKTMASRLVPHLYAAGEVLDIDGDCGGYNLQWAWASGHLAGRLL